MTCPLQCIGPAMYASERLHNNTGVRRKWSKVDVDDSFFTGLEEAGFQELEEISGANAKLLGADMASLLERANADLAPAGCAPT